MIFLDKNHPANGLKRVVEDCKAFFHGTVNVKKLYMVPELASADKPYRLSSKFPFSENFMT